MVCRRYLHDQRKADAARERLNQIVRAWLEGAPQLDSADPAHRAALISELTLDQATRDLGGAVNQRRYQYPCPGGLAIDLNLASASGFAYLSFMRVEPHLPKSYSDVLMREQTYYVFGDCSQSYFWVGSIFKSAKGNVAVRWRKLN